MVEHAAWCRTRDLHASQPCNCPAGRREEFARMIAHVGCGDEKAECPTCSDIIEVLRQLQDLCR